MHFTTDQIIQIAIALMPVIIAVFGIVFKLNQKDREELAHAADSALKRLATGEIDSAHAKELILATGMVSEKKVDKVLDAVTISLKDKKAQIFTDKLIPGVGVTVDTGGAVKIEPSGLLNKLSHKAGKWIKKTL
ncbi:MAG: hypothetical protein BWY28_02454 [bacterium ADurb.Bin236]|nr:MAG: hypothetical protein BWY28_02454 [bacterium ADurb.Bin236]